MSGRMIFLNLPVRDLPTARAFYEALGFRVNEYSSDDEQVAVAIDDTIVVTLVTRDRFAERVGGEVGDPARATTVINSLTATDRAEVDDLVARALAAGGTSAAPARENGAAYAGSFADPDGHVWEFLAMEPVHVID
jgi:predicted lactoylglutathione lyase